MSLPRAPIDWFYSKQTELCAPGLDYSGNPEPGDPGSRAFMSLLYGLSIVAVVLMPKRREDIELPSDGVELGGGLERESLKAAAPPKSSGDRWVVLDAVRIACVVGVVAEHSGGDTYSYHDSLFVTQWVLQWLFIVSGFAFMKSRSSFSSYFVRYFAVFVIGVTCNVIGDSISRPGWYNDLGNTIFQMFYVVMIVLVSFLGWPIRAVMRLEDDPYGGNMTLCGLSERLCVLVLYGGCFAACYFLYVLGYNLDWLFADLSGVGWSSYVVDFSSVFYWMMSRLFFCPTLMALHVWLRRTPESAGWLTWIFVVLVYLPPTLFPMEMAYGPQCIMLYILGFYVCCHTLAGSDTIRTYIRAYLVLFVVVVMLEMYEASLLGRCDRYPAQTVWERFRWYFNEMVLAILLCTRTVDASDPLDLHTPLGWWALWAFCAHLMFARTIPVPYGAVTTYLTAIPFLVAFKCVMPAMGYTKERRPPPTEGVASAAEPMMRGSEKPAGYGSFAGFSGRSA